MNSSEIVSEIVFSCPECGEEDHLQTWAYSGVRAKCGVCGHEADVEDFEHPASVIDPSHLIETSRWTDLWLAIPCSLLLFIAWLVWRLA